MEIRGNIWKKQVLRKKFVAIFYPEVKIRIFLLLSPPPGSGLEYQFILSNKK